MGHKKIFDLTAMVWRGRDLVVVQPYLIKKLRLSSARSLPADKPGHSAMPPHRFSSDDLEPKITYGVPV